MKRQELSTVNNRRVAGVMRRMQTRGGRRWRQSTFCGAAVQVFYSIRSERLLVEQILGGLRFALLFGRMAAVSQTAAQSNHPQQSSSPCEALPI